MAIGSVISWMEQASVEEIGEALLSVGHDKAMGVVGYLLSRFGPEVGPKIDAMVRRFEADPGNTLGQFVKAGLSSFLNDG